MAWAMRIAKLGLVAGGFLIYGWLALGVLVALVLLWALFSAEDAFWAGID